MERFEIIRSRSDNRDYRGLRLENRLKVMLVSDPTTDKSAAAMDVHVGSMSDPWDIPGLAHFLEHMLFLGTEKYPDENEYSKFLSSHNGSCNAFTAGTHTNYYFDVGPEYLGGALDRFGQFFLGPLLTESATDREMQAVDSENQKSIQNDSWRLHILEKSWGTKDHDFNKFGCGNIDTLRTEPLKKGLNVREELLKFHQKWYSSNIMSLAVLGKEPLDELEKMVTDLFAKIPDKDVKIPEWTEHPYPPNTGLQVMKVVPVKDVRHLTLTFPIPDLRKHYKTSPASYFSHLLGHEGKGSILSELKRRKWCNGLSAGERSGADGFGFFAVSTDLTLEGISHVDEIVELIFQYLNVLRQAGTQKWIFEENAKVDQMLFDFKDKERPQSYVMQLSGALHNFPMEDVLRANYASDEFNPDLIDDLLSRLVPNNARVRVAAQKFEDVATETEKWFGSKHVIEQVDSEVAERWNTVEAHPNLSLHEPNPFIPTNFDMCARDTATSSMAPSVIIDSPLLRLWYRQDDEFLLPKAVVQVGIFSPIAYVNPDYANCNKMFETLFSDAVNEELYPAEIAGLYYSLSHNRYGLTLYMSGYHDKQGVLLDKILSAMSSFKVDENRFKIFKESYTRSLKNFDTEQPYRHASYYNQVLLTQRYWSKADLIQSMESIEAQDVQEFVKVMFKNVHIQCLMSGNLTPQKALQYGQLVESHFKTHFKSKPLTESEKLKDREFMLPENSNLFHMVKNQVHPTSCIEAYYQVGLQETNTNVVLEFLAKLINEPCMNILRTKEQLGYIVWSGVRRSCGTQGLYVVVQSDREPRYLNERIERFLDEMRSTIENMKDEEFEADRQSLLDRKLEKPKRLSARVARFWAEILGQQYNFERDNVETEELKKVNRKEILEFFDKFISAKSQQRKKIACFIVPSDESTLKTTDKNDLESEQPELVPTVSAMKAKLPLYPQPLPYKIPKDFIRKIE